MSNIPLQLQQRLVHFLKMARKKNGYTQKDLANYLNRSSSHIERLESTTSADNFIINSILELTHYAKLMNFSATDLVGYIEGKEKPVDDPILSKLLENFNSLSTISQVYLIELLEHSQKDTIEKLLKLSWMVIELDKNIEENNSDHFSQILKLLSEAVSA